VIRARRLALLGHVARLDHAVPAWKALDVKGGTVPSPWVNHVKEDVADPLDSVMLLVDDRQLSLESPLLSLADQASCWLLTDKLGVSSTVPR